MATTPSKPNSDPMGWLKLNVGLFSTDITNYSDTHVAIYIKLLILYWTSNNKLPENRTSLNRRVNATTPTAEVALQEVLDELFVKGGDGSYKHSELDRQLEEIKFRSHQQSVRASQPRGSSTQQQPTKIYNQLDEHNF